MTRSNWSDSRQVAFCKLFYDLLGFSCNGNEDVTAVSNMRKFLFAPFLFFEVRMAMYRFTIRLFTVVNAVTQTLHVIYRLLISHILYFYDSITVEAINCWQLLYWDNAIIIPTCINVLFLLDSSGTKRGPNEDICCNDSYNFLLRERK